MTSFSTRDVFYIVVILAAIGTNIWFYFSGESHIKQAYAAAAQQAKDAKEAQAKADEANSKGVIDDLKTELAAARTDSLKPLPVIRLCDTREVRTNPPGRPSTTTVPVPTTPAGGVSGVPQGPGSGTDMGPSLQRLASSCDTVSAYERATQVWAVKQGQ